MDDEDDSVGMSDGEARELMNEILDRLRERNQKASGTKLLRLFQKEIRGDLRLTEACVRMGVRELVEECFKKRAN